MEAGTASTHNLVTFFYEIVSVTQAISPPQDPPILMAFVWRPSSWGEEWEIKYAELRAKSKGSFNHDIDLI